MAKFRVWVSTNTHGSECEEEVEIDDGEIEGLSKEEIWDEYLKDVMFDMIECGSCRVQ